jgi:phosphate-selective porin OprO/OprP
MRRLAWQFAAMIGSLLLPACGLAQEAAAGSATTFQLRGRLDTDAIATSQSTANEATFGHIGNAVGIRRAWIGAEGDLAIGGRYVSIIDLASGSIIIRDLFVGLGNLQDQGEFRAGHYLEPFSLEVGTPSFALPFLECSVMSVMDPVRDWGLSFFRSRTSDSTNIALGVFQAGTDPNDFQTGEGSTVAATGRLTAAPLDDADNVRLLHWGVALSERLPERGVILVTQQPQTSLLGFADIGSSPFVSKIRIPATFQHLMNLQFAAMKGSLWTQAEWDGTWIDRLGGGTVFFWGCHADCGYFLTGEHRPFQSGTGVWGPVRVDRPFICCHCDDDRPLGWGAWELTARFAYLDFQDADTPRGPSGEIIGLRLAESTFGVNWYLTDHLRLMFNYSYVLPEEPNTGISAANIYSGRLGVFW